MRVHPDTYPTRLLAFLARDAEGIPQWFDWTDATTPRTADPVRFYATIAYGCEYRTDGVYPERSFTTR